MRINRREFLKAGGATALVLGTLPLAQALADKEPVSSDRKAKWGLAIDVRKCWEKQQAGCRECIKACHYHHNVPEMDSAKNEIKWIWSAPFTAVFPELEGLKEESLLSSNVLALCNHCENAPCVRVCPTKATFQTPSGITVMDYHRCIGCRYCMAACPYGARSFNFTDPRPFIKEANPAFPTREKGVVEKCNLCDERIALGQRPICVEVCPHQALYFGNLNDPGSEVRQVLAGRFSLQRKAELGTKPKVYYLV
ncbi:MAG TPA: 4Fe-4S dicluster domain-containing protein [Clostridia bacterium]|nr:4Fe-4S dicluster domain-containing protein [Clostridia bacterium]